MTSKQDAQRIELSDEQLADLKKAIADLAEGKRVTPDKLSPIEFAAEHELPPLNQAPPLLQIEAWAIINHATKKIACIAWQHKWPLASSIVGIVLGFVLSVL